MAYETIRYETPADGVASIVLARERSVTRRASA